MKVLLIAYDNGSYIHWFPQGLAYVASALKKTGHEIDIYSQDMNHYPDEHLTDYLDHNHYDVVGTGVCGGYYQYQKLLKIAEAINNSKDRPFFMMGGHGPSPDPEYFLNKTKGDAIVIGEGEETVVELADAISANRSLKDIDGLAYRDGDKVIVNKRRALIQDIDQISWPAYELFPIDYYRLLKVADFQHGSTFAMPVLSGRGCPFKCTYCYRMDEGFRARSSESIIEEIAYLNKDHNIDYILFSDELLMSSVSRTTEFCEALIKSNLKVHWDCNGRLNYAKPELLKLMKQAGCTFINYGIESMDNQVLRNMKKGLTTKQVETGVKATIDAGIHPGLNIIFGNIGDNRETLQKGVDFMLKYDTQAQRRTIRPVTPYPGSELYYDAIEKGLLKDCADFYENKHLNSDLLAVNFTELSDNEFYEALKQANLTLLENYYNKLRESTREQVINLYDERDTSFRGFRQ